MIEKGVFDTGPFLHLSEIDALEILDSTKINVTSLVAKELERKEINVNINTIKLSAGDKDKVELLARKYGIQLADASCILIAKKRREIFFTDDYDARVAAQSENLKVHGTPGLLLRSYREGILEKYECIEKVKKLKHSSLFITERLIKEALDELEEYSKSQK